MGTIAQKLAKLAQTKLNIKSAIIAKGVAVPEATTFADYATKISEIPTGITPSGNIELQQQTGTDVTNYATASVKDGTATTPDTTKKQSTPTFSLSGTTVTASVAASSVSVTPSVTAGWVTSGTAGTVTLSASSATYTIPTQSKTATDNGTVSPDSGNFLSSVVVNVPYTTYRTGSGAPSASLGNDGDLYVDLG